jgi:hypothetical protein
VCGWPEMVEVKGPAGLSPLLPQETIDTPKGEFVPEPGPIAAIVRIALRSVPADVGHGGIRKRRHRFRSASAFANSS